MRLAINGEHVSYSLETERTLGEVVSGVQEWLAASGFLVTGLEADTRDLLQTSPQEWSPLAVSAVSELRVTATHTGDMRIEHWRTIHAWMDMLREEIGAPGPSPAGTGDTDALQELLVGLPQTLESFSANPFLPPGSDLARRFGDLFKGTGADEVRAWPPGRRAEAEAVLAELTARIESRLTDALHPREALARSARALKELRGGLSEVSVLLQTGRDRQAMDIVIAFTDAAQALIDVLPFLPPDAERARLISELTPVLHQLAAAFDGRDAILIGDLLEYEIAPRVDRITPLLENGMILLQTGGEIFRSTNGIGSANLLPIFGIILGAVVVLILVGGVIARRAAPRGAADLDGLSPGAFKKAGKAIGLTPLQVQALENLVRACKVRQPFLVFTSPGLLDETLRKGLSSIDNTRDISPEERENRRTILFQIKQTIEASARKGATLGSTTSLRPGQVLTVTPEGGPPFSSRVVSNMKDFLTVAAPSLPAGAGSRWMRGTGLSVYFWRDNDAGYSFPSKVLGYDTIKGVSSVLIQHSRTLRRAQRRRGRRRELLRPCFYYPIRITETGEGRRVERKAIVEKNLRTLGTVVDLSHGGCAIQTLNPVEKGRLVMIEFDIDRRQPIHVFGKVVRVKSRRGTGGTMNVMFTRVSRQHLNQISEYVYDLSRPALSSRTSR